MKYLATLSYALLTSSVFGQGAPLMGLRDVEPDNNTSLAAPSVYYGDRLVLQGIFTLGAGDVDCVKVSGANEAFLVMTTPLGGAPGHLQTPDTVIEVLDPMGNLLMSDDDAGSDFPVNTARGSVVRFVATQATNYTIRVRGFNSSAVGAYLLTIARITFTGADSYPDWISSLNFGPPDALSLDLDSYPLAYGFGTMSNFEDDYIAVNLSAGDFLVASSIGVEHLNVSWDTPDVDLAIVNENGSITYANSMNDGGGLSPGTINSSLGGTIRFIAPEDGVYHLRCHNTSGSGFYGVMTARLPAPPACEGDADGNGVVNFADITNVLSNFNLTCP